MDTNSAETAAEPVVLATSGNATQPASDVPSGDAAPASPDTTSDTGTEGTQSADAAAPNDDGDTGDTPRKPDRSAARRIGGLTREVRAREREIGELRGLLRAQGINPDALSGTPQQPASDNGEPRQDQFQTYEDYTRALARYEARMEHQRLNREAAEKTTAQRLRESMKAVRGEAADFDEVVASVFEPEFPNSKTMADFVEESDQPARMLYWLGNNPDEAARISQLSPIRQAKELAKVEATLAAPAPQPKRPGAPPPPKIVTGSGVGEKDPAKMSMEEYAKYRGFA